MKDKKKSDANKTKVRDAEINDEKFIDDDGDKRLIVFVAAAILIIVGTIIGFLVGCKKEETDEPKKPVDDIVVPEKKDDKGKENDKEAYNDVVRPLPVVRKVTTKTKAKTTEKTTDDEGETESTSHNVTFYNNGNNEVVEIKSEEDIKNYAPKGYTNCNVYTDEELTIEYDFEEELTEDKNLYLS